MKDDKLDAIAIGTRIKMLRLELGLTQLGFAQKLGLSYETAIANYESGYSIPKDNIKYKMCKLFNCSMDYLLCLSDIRSPEKIEIDTDKIKIGLSAKDYTEITDTQKKQIEDFARYVLKDNEKKNKKNNN